MQEWCKIVEVIDLIVAKRVHAYKVQSPYLMAAFSASCSYQQIASILVQSYRS